MTQQTMGSVIPEFTVSDRLRKAREVTGLDQTQFAAEIDVSRGTVSNYERAGGTNMRRIVLKAWALRTGVPLEWIETGVAGPQDDGDGGAAMRPRQDSNLRPRDYKGAGAGQPSWAPVAPLRERRANPLSRPAAQPAAALRSAA